MGKRRKEKHRKRTGPHNPALESAKEMIERREYGSARESLSKLLTSEPDHATAWHLFGAVNIFMGDHESATNAFKKATSLAPANVEFQNDLAGVYLTKQLYSEAESLFSRVVQLAPDSLEAKYNLATCLLEQGKYVEAIPLMEKVYDSDPTLLEAAFNLAIAHRKLGNSRVALDWFRRAEPLSAHNVAVTLETARCYRSLDAYTDAATHYQRLNDKFLDSDLTMEIAETLYLAGERNKALSIIRTGAERFPKKKSEFEILEAEIALNLGDIELARKKLAPLLKDISNTAFPVAAIVGVRIGLTDEYDLVGKLSQCLEKAPTKEIEARIRFALGHAHDEAGAYQLAASQYQRANELRAASSSYDRFSVENTISVMGKVFASTPARPRIADANAAKRPIFVLGMPRSGTTLVEQIIASHPQVSGAGELGFFTHVTRGMKELLDLEEDYPRCIADLTVAQLKEIRQAYLQLSPLRSLAGPYVVDKFPENFLHVGLIKSLFPSSVIFHVQRDPRNVALSIYFQNFERGNAYSWRLGDIAHYYAQYERVMQLWASLKIDGLVSVTYEQLVEDVETHSRRLVEAIGVPWDESCLTFYRSKSDVRTASNWQVRQPIYRQSLARWKNYPEFVDLFCAELHKQRQRFDLPR
ncbi:MAG: tetratricopeptide repeat-containing sulfotransferase family protein [Gammaproteobacteria bacterium]